MYAFTHKFHVHILQEYTVDTDRCVCLYASAPARYSDCRCTFVHAIVLVRTASNRRYVVKPSCRTHGGSALTTCRPPTSCSTRPSCRTNSMFGAAHSTQVHLPATSLGPSLVTPTARRSVRVSCERTWACTGLGHDVKHGTAPGHYVPRAGRYGRSRRRAE